MKTKMFEPMMMDDGRWGGRRLPACLTTYCLVLALRVLHWPLRASATLAGRTSRYRDKPSPKVPHWRRPRSFVLELCETRG